jgi:type III secretion protein R
MILTLFSMYPVFSEIKLKLEPIPQLANVENLMQVWDMVKEPVREFMVKHAHPQDRELFAKMISSQSKLDENDFIILAPAFLISELSQAFHMGFLVYLPFLVIDMTVANLLMALGMQMLSPTTISLPFKILLFVLVDGWRLLAEGLVRS